jgi:hypothetical protein
LGSNYCGSILEVNQQPTSVFLFAIPVFRLKQKNVVVADVTMDKLLVSGEYFKN